MKACPICGSTFSGDEMFCPHDGARLIVRDQPAQLVGEQLHHLVDLKRLLFKDAFGERYIGEMTSSHVEVKVTVFNQAFSPPESRLEALVSTKMLLDSPLPPQVATTYAWSLDDDPSYLIESHPKGPSLRLLLDERGHIDWRTALKIICSLARNLDWMDGNGVVHRALQPENIYVTDIQRGYTHLSEWAIGVLAYQGNPLEAVSQGNLVIAPNYTAPELVDGKGSADRRSTIYTLGILIYEMLTGKSPFSAPGSEETLKRIKRERPVKLSMAYPEGDLPPGLDDLFEVMTSKQPDKRFQSLQAVTNAMSTLLDDGTSASDFPEPVRAKEETDIHKKNGKTSSKKEDVEDTTSKKTMLFISSDDLQRQISEAAEVAEVVAPAAEAPAESKKAKKAPEPTPEKKAEKEPKAEPSPSTSNDDAKDETEGDGEIDEVSKATIQMDRSVLEEDQKASEAKKATKEADDKPTAATKDNAGSDADSEPDDDKSTARKKKRKKKRKRTDLMHEAANVANALNEQNKADAEKAKEADTKESKGDDSSNGVQVDDPSPTGSFTKLDETKGGTTKIIIDEEFARDAKDADTPSIVVDASLTEEAEDSKKTKSKSISGSSATQTSEKERPASKKSDAKDDAKEKEDNASAKKSAKTSDSEKAKEDDAKTKDKAPEKADAKKAATSESKDDGKKDTSKSTTTTKSSKPDDKDADDSKTKKSSKRTSKKSRKPDRNVQEETARLPAAKTETKPGKEDSKGKDTPPKASASASASADATSDNMEFLPQLTNDANLDEQWFSTDTEAAWDREVLMEHTARTEQKVNKALIIAIAAFVIAVLSFFIYIMFIHEPDESDEEASLDRPVIEMQTKMAAHLPGEDTRDNERA